MSYFEYYGGGPQLKPGDVIDWDPPAVDFEFIAGVCVQVGSVEKISLEWQPGMPASMRDRRDLERLWRVEAQKKFRERE
jgi:hypothetical protein